jgi:hypothetical protein
MASSGSFDPGCESIKTKQRERSASKKKPVSGIQAADEGFFDGAESATTTPLDFDSCIRRNCADVHSVPTSQCGAGNVPSPKSFFDSAVVRVGRKSMPSASGEVERPLPGLVVKICKRDRSLHFLIQVVLTKASTTCHCHDVL